MPKKYHKYSSIKPTNLPHPSLSPSPRHQHGASSSTPEPSVNDLINRLRRTQVSPGEGAVSSTPRVVPRSVHPSIRNILEIPETPPPRPRPSARRIGGERIRRTPGPPPPFSWLEGSSQGEERNHERLTITAGSERVLYRLERLPGVTFPAKDSLQHAVLKSMASNWNWHLDYDGEFLSELPTRMKMLLLSYIMVYAKDQQAPRNRGQGLRPLFSTQHEGEEWLDEDREVTRLDMSGALGHWIGFRQLNGELMVSSSNEAQSSVIKAEGNVPSSWDAESEEESGAPPIPSLLKSPVQTLRFENLRFLSLAHPNPGSASWVSLLNLLSHMSTLTHLSLAHWPVPTLTPNAINSRIRHPTIRSLTFSYGGTDAYSAYENNWAEASSVLRKLSRVTYCLKWLDLEGCGAWFGALSWDGIGPEGEIYTSPGPEWNTSWRNIEWVGLGPGWLPEGEDSGEYGNSPSRSLHASIHSPLSSSPNRTTTSSISPDPALVWDVEEEREKYLRAKEMEAYRDVLGRAKRVQDHVRAIRREEKGKWIRFSFGGDGVEERAMLKRAGVDFGF